MYRVLNTLSEYTCFYTSKSIASYTFSLFLKSSKDCSVSLSDLNKDVRNDDSTRSAIALLHCHKVTNSAVNRNLSSALDD